MKQFKYLTSCLLAFMFFSCNTAAYVTRDHSDIWLNSKLGVPALDMTGIWDAGGMASGGWGKGNFTQRGCRFSGSLGMYHVYGVVNGEDVYMSINSGEIVNFTAHLKKTANGSLTGKSVERTFIDKPEAEKSESYSITLKKDG